MKSKWLQFKRYDKVLSNTFLKDVLQGPGIAVHAPRAWEADAEGCRVQGSLDYTLSTCLKVLFVCLSVYCLYPCKLAWYCLLQDELAQKRSHQHHWKFGQVRSLLSTLLFNLFVLVLSAFRVIEMFSTCISCGCHMVHVVPLHNHSQHLMSLPLFLGSWK